MQLRYGEFEHGSHFAVDGTPLNAPAVSALAPIQVTQLTWGKRSATRTPAPAKVAQRGLTKAKEARTAGGTKPERGTKRAEKYQDGAKKSGGVGAPRHAVPGRPSKTSPKPAKDAQKLRHP